MPTDPLSGNNLTHCSGDNHFKRFYTLREDWFWFPPKRQLGANIKYLYHRWQTEYQPPFDWGSSEYLDYPGDPKGGINQGSTNVQAKVGASLTSGEDVPASEGGPNYLGGLDGHGEIVGFRGVFDNFLPDGEFWLAFESWPLALQAPDYWPSLVIEKSFNDAADRQIVRNFRVSLLKEWEADPDYLDNNEWAPLSPPVEYCSARNLEGDYCTYCMVSGDLCEILRTAVTLPLDADAGPDQAAECSGPKGASVTLDGSGSSDPNEGNLTFAWVGPFGTLTGETITTNLPVGTHTIILTVEDEKGKMGSDTVDITVTDSSPPSLNVSLSPDYLWPPNHKMVEITASIQISDSCDADPNVELVSIISNEPDNGSGDGNTINDIQGANYGTDDRNFSLRAERAGNGITRIYTITYGAMDSAGNVTEQVETVRIPASGADDDKDSDSDSDSDSG